MVTYYMAGDNMKKNNTCIARADCGRIELLINKKDKGYKNFAKIFNSMENPKNKIIFWYGDIDDNTGKETEGIIITTIKK